MSTDIIIDCQKLSVSLLTVNRYKYSYFSFIPNFDFSLYHIKCIGNTPFSSYFFDLFISLHWLASFSSFLILAITSSFFHVFRYWKTTLFNFSYIEKLSWKAKWKRKLFKERHTILYSLSNNKAMDEMRCVYLTYYLVKYRIF